MLVACPVRGEQRRRQVAGRSQVSQAVRDDPDGRTIAQAGDDAGTHPFHRAGGVQNFFTAGAEQVVVLVGAGVAIAEYTPAVLAVVEGPEQVEAEPPVVVRDVRVVFAHRLGTALDPTHVVVAKTDRTHAGLVRHPIHFRELAEQSFPGLQCAGHFAYRRRVAGADRHVLGPVAGALTRAFRQHDVCAGRQAVFPEREFFLSHAFHQRLEIIAVLGQRPDYRVVQAATGSADAIDLPGQGGQQFTTLAAQPVDQDLVLG